MEYMFRRTGFIKRGKIMKSIRVRFEQAKDIVDFVKTASRYNYDIDVRCGSVVVDAKSLVGVMAVASRRVVEVVAHTEECGDLLAKVACYAA